ncbi:MAG TPA: hypothetical protein VMF90_18385 [Rhizobiaceae bacterium]|nr:hypothetical protein [Rhizobiaceae bacterium]
MEILAALEQLGVIRALKVSFFAYPIVNALHIMSIGALFTSVFLMDFRLLGAFGSLPAEPFVRLLRRVALIAFLGAALTGLTMFAVRATDYALMPVFLLKMALIALAALNFVAFIRLARNGGTSTALRISVVLSLLLWTAVILAGRFIGFL